MVHNDCGMVNKTLPRLDCCTISTFDLKCPKLLLGNDSVFINAPFDKISMNRIVYPMVFAIIAHGYKPVLSLENNNCGQQRIDKIVNAIRESVYSIHDLSLLGIDKLTKVARMNMPFELGLDFGLNLNETKRKLFVMGNHRYNYMKAISDLNGIDISDHSNCSQNVIECVSRFLNPNDIKTLAPLELYYLYIKFQAWLYLSLLSDKGYDVAKDSYKKLNILCFITEINKWINLNSK